MRAGEQQTRKARGRPDLVSVVMPTYNGAGTIRQQLEALEAQTYDGPWEVVVADNGSTDATVEVVRTFEGRLPNLRIISVTSGQGVAYASNAGARASGGGLIAWCHQDDIATPGWLAAIVDAAGRYDMVGGANDHETLNDPIVRVWRPPPAPGELPTALGFLPYAVGDNLAMWRDVFDAVGGWPEDSSYGGEDIELSWLVQLAGYELGFAEDAVMQYRFRSDVSELWRQFVGYGQVQPHLYRKYRELGMPRSSSKSAIKTWIWGLLRVGDLWGEPGRKGAWVRKMAYRWGRLKGSIQARVLYL